MAEPKKRKQWRLSASSITCFKKCPYKYFLKYIKGIKLVEEPGHFRYGTNWHRIMEVISLKPNSRCSCTKLQTCVYPADPECLICGGVGVVPKDIMESVTRVIDDAYSRIPNSVDPEDWAVERAKLLYSAVGYNWYYQNEPLKATHTEVRFSTPIPGRTGRMIPNLLVTGVIDKIIKNAGNMVVEHKITSKSVAPDSKYWGKLTLDTQTSLYTYVLQLLRGQAKLNLTGEISGFYYDVFHKPGIKPKFLSIAASKKFVEDGKYYGGKFIVDSKWADDGPAMFVLDVSGTTAIVEMTAKEGQYKIKETPDMYGHRLLADIVERPEFYFARREMAKTNADSDQFHRQLLGIISSLRAHLKNDSWYKCEGECENEYNCEYIDLCYNGIDPDGQLPATLIKRVKGGKE